MIIKTNLKKELLKVLQKHAVCLVDQLSDSTDKQIEMTDFLEVDKILREGNVNDPWGRFFLPSIQEELTSTMKTNGFIDFPIAHVGDKRFAVRIVGEGFIEEYNFFMEEHKRAIQSWLTENAILIFESDNHPYGPQNSDRILQTFKEDLEGSGIAILTIGPSKDGRFTMHQIWGEDDAPFDFSQLDKLFQVLKLKHRLNEDDTQVQLQQLMGGQLNMIELVCYGNVTFYIVRKYTSILNMAS